MIVQSAPTLVPFWDASELQVTVQDTTQAARHVEYSCVRRQGQRDWLASGSGLGLESDELIGETSAKIVRQVGADGNAVSLAVLLVGGI
jgi:hypothetical protein